MQDGTHTIERSGVVTSRVLAALYTELFDQRVDLAGTLLKPNMVLSGYEASSRAGVEDVAKQTLHCFTKHVPAAVPGIVFLSGGQSDEDATAHLNAMNATRPASVAAVLLLRPRFAGTGVESLGRQDGERRGGAAGVLPPREAELGRAHGHVRAGDGAGARDRVKLTDAGLETVLVFEDGIDLPEFAAFPLVDTDEGRAALKRYYTPVPRARP